MTNTKKTINVTPEGIPFECYSPTENTPSGVSLLSRVALVFCASNEHFLEFMRVNGVELQTYLEVIHVTMPDQLRARRPVDCEIFTLPGWRSGGTEALQIEISSFRARRLRDMEFQMTNAADRDRDRRAFHDGAMNHDPAPF